jgi:ferredoxin-thioredoxin reductase catalytic subunit/rubredoxin
MSAAVPDATETDRLYARLDKDAEASGYHLNPDKEFTRSLVEGLLINKKRYGYMACPCRLADGDKKSDLDIICPCDYRDSDLNDFNTCYCKLYVSLAVKQGTIQVHSIPERRPPREQRAMKKNDVSETSQVTLWRCPVCGYLCAREHPPEVCPICKAGKERFEKFDFASLPH